ncbi:hypothetical protein ANN_14048 [Periplaneta americana]|uniref:HTH psq-type domain-containing protein n=1 Tax=Periplaneta americana TaxID=6978 RepID=A0ABQ8SW87_PERAM|nr:hypothetical protein ANN_14048 [Periplaneta americana]
MADSKPAILRYSEESMAAALNAVRKGQSITSAAKEFGVPKTTLLYKASGKYPEGRKMGPDTLFTKEEESFLSKSLPSKETLRGHSDSSFRGEGYIQCCVGVRLCDMYSNQELAEIHFMYGKADGNAALARRLYQERYPQRQCPDRKTFVRLHYRLCEYGKFNSHGLGRGRPRSTTPEVQEEILEAVNMTPSISTRRVALQVNVPHTTVWRLLKEYQLYPYHLQRVQALSPADYPARVRFCQWFLQQCGVNPNFPALVLFTDEAQFTRDGITNFHNQHVGRMKTHVQLFHLITRCGSPSTCGPVSLVID